MCSVQYFSNYLCKLLSLFNTDFRLLRLHNWVHCDICPPFPCMLSLFNVRLDLFSMLCQLKAKFRFLCVLYWVYRDYSLTFAGMFSLHNFRYNLQRLLLKLSFVIRSLRMQCRLHCNIILSSCMRSVQHFLHNLCSMLPQLV
mmetsp:Transcript_3720/g.7968  ORF Transcript_3720/g.7968 Transcript_3720/m.7968 type:complete len:142 (-) Transcript_3720:3-428(-)